MIGFVRASNAISIGDTPSPCSAGHVITCDSGLNVMGLERTVNQRISFLMNQIDSGNPPTVNDIFQLQIDVPRNVERERLEMFILQKKQELEHCNTIYESDRLFTELEALEWLQRQAGRNK